MLKKRRLSINSHESPWDDKMFRDLVNFDFTDRPDIMNTDFPSIDIIDQGTTIFVRAQVPGISEDNLEIAMAPDHVVISGESYFEKENKGDTIYHFESHSGSFLRTIPFPSLVVPETTKIDLENGVLSIIIEKESLPTKQQLQSSTKTSTTSSKKTKKKTSPKKKPTPKTKTPTKKSTSKKPFSSQSPTNQITSKKTSLKKKTTSKKTSLKKKK